MINILCADISAADENDYDRLYSKASPERKKRADRCRRFEDKLRCVTADALLKRVLDTEEIQVGTNEWGKPYVVDRPDFYYNISHSGSYVVLAWGEAEMGIDVQQHRTGTNMYSVARRCFTEDEQTYMGDDPGRFYEIWTKKESYLKYTGKGLCADMKSFSVMEENGPWGYRHCMLGDAYSLSLCSIDLDWTMTFLKAQQL